MKSLLLVLLGLAVALNCGCATMADVRQARGEGTSKTYSASFDVVWKAVSEALPSLGLTVTTDNKQEGYILAERKATGFTWGEKVAVFVTSVGSTETRVEVVSKRVLATNFTATDWEPKVLQRVEQVLAQGK